MRIRSIKKNQSGRVRPGHQWPGISLWVLLGCMLQASLCMALDSSSGEQEARQDSLKPVLRWAADASSGAPYVFPDPKDPTRIIGFEVELVDALSKELGVQMVFVPNQWDGLIPGLLGGLYDMVINGMVIRSGVHAGLSFSIPYYWSYEKLVVREDETRIHHLDDCVGKTVGLRKDLRGDAQLGMIEGIRLRYYENEFNAFEDLLNGRIDAVYFDSPEVDYFTRELEGLKVVGRPSGSLLYGVAMRAEDELLLSRMNEAILALQKNGLLKQILQRWGLLNDRMETLLGATELSEDMDADGSLGVPYLDEKGPTLSIQDRLLRYASLTPLLFKGAFMTLRIAVLSMLMAVLGGLFLAILRVYGSRSVSTLSVCLIEGIRGIPLLIQLYFIFYGLPSLGIRLSPFVAGVIALGMNYAAYEAENYRAGINAIPREQMEAARALGMSHLQSLRHVILPQAFRLVIPTITSDFISLIKDSSLVSVITIVELTQMYAQLASSYYDYLGIGLLVGIFYLILGLPFLWLSRKAEQRLSIRRRSPKKAKKETHWREIV